MKKCPYCAEEIQDEAIKCRYCGSDLIKKREENEVEKQKIFRDSMKTFRYRAITKDKETKEGVISARDQKEVIDVLSLQGLFLTDIKEISIPEEKRAKTRVRAKDHSSYWAFTMLGLIIPLIGFIVGIIYLTKKDLLDRKLGEHTIVMSAIGVIISSVLVAMHIFTI